VLARLRPILRLARKRGVFVNVDMEQYAFKDATIRIFRNVMADDEFRDWRMWGSRFKHICATRAMICAPWPIGRSSAAVRSGCGWWKGAYWDYESVIAVQNDWPLPVWAEKTGDGRQLRIADRFPDGTSHAAAAGDRQPYVRSIAHALAQAEAHGVPARGFEFQMLYGMAEPIKAALVVRWGSACASTRPSGSCCRAWRISSDGCWRIRRRIVPPRRISRTSSRGPVAYEPAGNLRRRHAARTFTIPRPQWRRPIRKGCRNIP